jgi:hypothetical protein
MYFNGSSYLTGSISAASSTTITVFLVGSLIVPFTGFSGLLCFGNPSQFDYDNNGSLPITMYNDQLKIYGARNSSSQPTPVKASVPFVYALQYDGTYINTWLNGKIQTVPSSNVSSSGTFTYTHYAVGSRAGTILGAYLWSGYLGEIIVYQSPVSTTKRQEIEGYLAWKWGFIPPAAPTGFVPTSISGNSLWLDAEDPNANGITPSNGSVVSFWYDKSGTSRDMTAPYPSSNVFYTNPSRIYLNGSSYFSNGSSFGEIYTMFIVYKQTSAGAPIYGTQTNAPNGGITGLFANESGTTYIDTGGNWYTQTSSIPISNTNLLTVQYTGAGASANLYLWLNGSINISYTTIGSRTNSLLLLGARTSTNAFLTGDFYEVIQYDSSLSTSQRQQVEGYLMKKWSITSIDKLITSHPFISVKPYLRIFQPTDILGCALWLDGSDKSSMTLSGNNVTQWNDKSGNGYNFVTQGSFAPPVISNNAISTKSAVLFTGNNTQNDSANQILTNSSFPLNSSTEGYSIFVVSKQNSSHPTYSGYNYLVSAYGGGAGNGLIYGTTYSNYLITANGTAGPISGFNDLSDNIPNTLMTSTTQTGMVVSGSVLTPYLNGVAMTTKTGTCVALTGISIGNAYAPGQSFTAQTWGGLICEVFIYNSALTTAQRQQVEGYLAWKWGLQTSLSNIHPFYKFRSSTALPFLPNQISGLSLWLDGNDPAGTGLQPSAGSLATWIDKSGSNNHMTAVGTTPTFSNYPPGAVYFAGNGYFSNSNAVLSNVYTVFFIFKNFIDSNLGFPVGPLYATGIESSGAFFLPNFSNDPELTVVSLDNTSSNIYAAPTSFPLNQMNLAVLSFSGNEAGCNISLYYNGSNVVSTTQDEPLTYSNLRLGYYDGAAFYYTGYMYEVIAYNGTLTTNQRQSVEGYLAQKWKL